MARNDKPANPPPLRTCKPNPRSPSRTETKLDTLLNRYKKRTSEAEPVQPTHAPSDPVENLRERFRTELIPVFQQLADKYASRSIVLHMDVGLFLSGGYELLIDIQFENHGVRLLGTVLPDRIAFQETRYTNNVGPAMTSGPTLRTRGLSGQKFREFICERIGELVRTALRQTTPAVSE